MMKAGNCTLAQATPESQVKKPIHVLLLANGQSVHTEKWIKGLGLCKDFRVTLVNMNPDGVREEIEKLPNVIAIHNFVLTRVSQSGNNFSYLFQLPKLWRLVRKIKPDVISTIYLTSYGLLGALVKGHSKLVHFMIGSDIMVTPDRSWLHKAVTRYALKKGDLFISTSASMTERLALLEKIPDDRLLTQQYGVEDWVIDYGVHSKKFDFASNRAWVANSNIPSLLDAFAQISSGHSLALVGEGGPLSDPIREKAEATPGVVCFGHLPYQENVTVIAQSTFYLSFTDSDGASLSLMEAMALGCIPIVSDIKPNREWVTHGKNGFIVNPRDPSTAARIMSLALEMSEDEKCEMQRINREIIRQKGSFTINMGRLNDAVIQLYDKVT